VKSSRSVAEIATPPDHTAGKPITPFDAEMMDGKTVHFPADYKGKIVMLDFWATWCGPCKMVAPVLEEIANEKVGALTVAKIDVDANPATARDFQVVSIPTMILFKDGAPVKRIVGAKGKAALLRELADVV
jgi:thioredoxin